MPGDPRQRFPLALTSSFTYRVLPALKNNVMHLHRPRVRRASLAVINARPIPSRPDPSALRRAGVTALARTAVAHILAKIDGGNPGQMAEKMFPGDGDVALLSKGAVATTTTGNMPALVQTLVPDFIASLGGVSAGAVLLGQSLQLKFDGNGAISIPTFVADAALVSFVREGYPIPARSLTGAPVLLDPSKLAVIVTLTNEVVTGSAGNAVKMVEDVLTRSTGLALDVALLDDQPAIDEVRPPVCATTSARCLPAARPIRPSRWRAMSARFSALSPPSLATCRRS